MFEFGKSLGNIVGHRDVNVPCGVVPIKSETKVAGAGPIFCEGISIMERGKQVVGVGLAKIFDTEIIDR
jgi:hypothetical protein